MTAPIKIGLYNDLSNGPPIAARIEPWLRFMANDYVTSGRIDRPIEIVIAHGLGLPGGTAAAVERAIAELVQQDVLLIVGPSIGDNAIVATPQAEKHRVPIINWAGSEHARSEYMFHLQVGSHEDDPIVVARHLASLGLKRIAVVYDRSHIGRRHFNFFQTEGDFYGCRIAAAVTISPVAEDGSEEIAQLLDSNPEAVVYLGIGQAAPAVARALRQRDWQGPRAMNTAGIRGYAPELGKTFEGWDYVDMISDGNKTLAALMARPDAPRHSMFHTGAGYDLTKLALEGVARATELTRDGIVEGLERVKWLSAAEGYEGTLMGFGIHDRGALHGRYLVMRRWQGGQSIEIS